MRNWHWPLPHPKHGRKIQPVQLRNRQNPALLEQFHTLLIYRRTFPAMGVEIRGLSWLFELLSFFAFFWSLWLTQPAFYELKGRFCLWLCRDSFCQSVGNGLNEVVHGLGRVHISVSSKNVILLLCSLIS